MSVTYVEPLIADPFEDVDEGRALHLEPEDGSRPTVCGAPASEHRTCPCSQTFWEGEAFCPGCGRPICAYCRLAAEGDFA